jgi:hypothetical protein
MWSAITFVVEASPEGGFTARAVGQSIFTAAATTEDLRTSVRDAVACHFDPEDIPKTIRLRFVRNGSTGWKPR